MADSDLDALKEWRSAWDFDALKWRDARPTWTDRRQQKKEQRQRERSVRDRLAFGEETWGISAAHRQAKVREDLLKQNHLPVLRTELELARWLGIPLTRLRWFTHDNPADTTWHYVRYTIPKRSGGERVILAPKTELKGLQRKILRDMLESIPVSAQAHGFVKTRSIVTNASPHVGRAFVLNMDLKDFFPSVTFARVRGLFIHWGYSFSVASALALLCTEREREGFQRSREQYWISVGPRTLVQGAPTSPALANLATWKLDARLRGLAAKHNFAYTRYADDLTFSGDSLDGALRILATARRIIAAEGFAVHPDKTRLQRRSGQQTVTGMVVNDKVSVPRAVRRQIRAILHNAEKTGLNAQNHENREHFRTYLHGIIGFIHEANAAEAERLLRKLQTLSD